MDFIMMEGGRGSRQAKPRRHDFYPKWGMAPHMESNARSLYRGGDCNLWSRYIVAPRAVPVLDHGITVGDAVVAACVAALLLLLGDACGMAFDRWLSTVGY